MFHMFRTTSVRQALLLIFLDDISIAAARLHERAVVLQSSWRFLEPPLTRSPDLLTAHDFSAMIKVTYPVSAATGILAGGQVTVK